MKYLLALALLIPSLAFAGFSNGNGLANSMVFSNPPTISSGFGTSPSISAINTFSFSLTVGVGGASSGTIALHAALNGWNCHVTDQTSYSSVITQQSGDTTTSASFAAFGMTTGLSSSWVAGDKLKFICAPY